MGENASQQIKTCVQVHEEVHIQQINNHTPGVCSSHNYGRIIHIPFYKQYEWECEAYKAELKCLDSAECKNSEIYARISQMHEMILLYCK